MNRQGESSFIMYSLSLFDVMNCFSSIFWSHYLLNHYIFLLFQLFFNVMNRIKIINQTWLELITHYPAVPSSFPAGINLFKVNKKISEQCVKYVQSHHLSNIADVKFEQIPHIVVVIPCRLWPSKFRMDFFFIKLLKCVLKQRPWTKIAWEARAIQWRTSKQFVKV